MGLHAAEPVHHHHHYHHHLFFFFGEIKNCLRKCRAAPTLSHRCTHGQVAFIGVSSSALSFVIATLSRSASEAKQISVSEESVEARVSLASLAHETCQSDYVLLSSHFS